MRPPSIGNGLPTSTAITHPRAGSDEVALLLKKDNRLTMIALFFHRYRWGRQIRGDERGFFEKAVEFDRMGVRMTVLEIEPSLQRDIGKNVYVSMNLGRRSVPPKNLAQLLILVLKSLVLVVRSRPSKPAIVYAYNQDVENVFTGFILKLVLRVPLAVVYHQVDPSSFLNLRQGIAVRKRKGYPVVNAIWNSILPALNRIAALGADFNLALSEATRRDIERYLGIKDSVLVGNGVDSEKFRPMNISKTFDAGFLGRLAPQKGIDIILNAWRRVVDEKADARLVLIGGGDKSHIDVYKRMIVELGLENNVSLTGFLPDQGVVETLNACRLFVFPSRMEGFAQAVSQAMACELCCILSDIPSLRGVYGEAAIFVPRENPAELARVILETYHDEKKKKSVGKRGRLLVTQFTWKKVTELEMRAVSRGQAAASVASPGSLPD